MMRALSAFKRIASLFLWMLAGFAISILAVLLVDGIYELLYASVPEVFPLYNAVLEEEDYERARLRLDIIALALTLFCTVYLSLRYDNAREERMISRTDGLFLIRKEYAWYLRAYIAEDAISSIIIGAVITVPFIFIPKKFLEMSNIFSSLLNLFYKVISGAGIIYYSLIAVSLLFISHLLGALFSMQHWRAKWLSGFGEVRQ